MKPVKAGKLTKRFEVQRNEAAPATTSDRNTFGELTERWVTAFWAWGSLEPISGREFWNAAQIQADITHRIVIRYRSDVVFTADMRLKIGARIFHLAGPPKDIEEAHRVWECLAVEVPTNPV